MNRPFSRSRASLAAGAAILAVGVLYPLTVARPLLHGPLMLCYQYPLITWMPLALAGVITAYAAVLGLVLERRVGARRDAGDFTYAGAILGAVCAAVMWIVCMIGLPAWQGRALYEETDYNVITQLPQTTQPRLLPKEAAQAYADLDDMRIAHLAVDPKTSQLIWTAEHKTGLIARGSSDEYAVQQLNDTDGQVQRVQSGFKTAVSAVGPGSLKWRAYKKRFFTKLAYPVIVPTPDGKAVAVAPYVAYKGLFVKRPYVKGVMVLHQDGRLEDLSLADALKRPELARSGRLIPESFARDIAEAHGYKSGAGAVFKGASRTKVTDPSGNPQPYLTSIGDGQVRWVTIAHSAKTDDMVKSIFLTDAATGRTDVWHAPRGSRVLSNRGAEKLAYTLPERWSEMRCCDADGYRYRVTLRYPTEARPVFLDGKFYYLVSIVPARRNRTLPVEKTVLVDATSAKIVRVFDHTRLADTQALRTFFSEQRSSGPGLAPARPSVPATGPLGT